MELAYGTEPRPEYYAFELAQAARKLIEEVVPLGAGWPVSTIQPCTAWITSAMVSTRG